MSTKEILILIGGGLHFLTLIASAMVPKTLDWKGELAKLIPFLRTLFWVYGIFIVLCIVSFGVISFVNYRALAGGTTLEARSICAFISIFWGLRLITGWFFFDVSEFLTNWFLKTGYHVLNLMFVFQTFVYGYCAFL